MLKSRNACRRYPNVIRLLEKEIYSRRREMKISQNELSARTGLSRNCIQQLECHEHVPHFPTLFDLMRGLEFSKREVCVFLIKFWNAYGMDKTLQQKQDEIC